MLRVLNDEENPYKDLPKGWFGSDTEAAKDHYAKQEGFEEGNEAQFKWDIAGFVELLEDTLKDSFVLAFSGASEPLMETIDPKIIREVILNLKQLVGKGQSGEIKGKNICPSCGQDAPHLAPFF